jgi:hypothetical protein
VELHNWQPALSRKHESILFLYSISLSPRPSVTVPSLLPSIVKPPTSRTAINSKSPSDPQHHARQQKGKAKADVLKDYRAKCLPHTSFLHVCVVFTYPQLVLTCLNTSYSETPSTSYKEFLGNMFSSPQPTSPAIRSSLFSWTIW